MNEKWNSENTNIVSILSDFSIPGYPDTVYAVQTANLPDLIDRLREEFKNDQMPSES